MYNHQPILPRLMADLGILPKFSLIDVGCSSGVFYVWGELAPQITAHGVDPLVSEVERLTRENAQPWARYYEGFATGPKAPRGALGWYPRTSAVAAHAAMQRSYEQAQHNQGAPLVYSERRFTLDAFVAENAIERVDFLKTDTDGSDYAVLAGAPEVLKNCLGVLVEASLVDPGGGAVFRNIDALMADRGFYAAHLFPKRYTRAALPGAFEAHILAETHTGGVNWFDVLFLRDLPQDGSRVDLDFALRLALICEIHDLPDVAAEALVRVRDQKPAEITALLDALVRYSGKPEMKGYDALIASFNADPKSFFRG